MRRILSLSPTAILPKPYPYRLHIPGGRVPKHELYLDLSSVEPKGWSSAYGTPPPGYFDIPSTRADWLPSIRGAVANHKDIDTINIYCCTPPEWGPDEEVWKALSGCQPTHLELNAGVLEECDYAGLEHVEPAWPLKSVYVQCCGGDGEYDWEGERGEGGPKWFKPSFPACYAGIETLVLHYGLDSLYFYPKGGVRNLRSLTIMENDSVATFARTVHCNPLTLQTLCSVTLGGKSCTDSVEKWHIERMKNFFLNAKALVNIELALNDPKPFKFSKDTSDDEGPASNEHTEDDDPATCSRSPSPYLGLSDVLPASSDEHPQDDDRATYQRPSPYLGLSDVLPASLTSISFRGPANELMLKDLDNWIRNAKRAAWLPSLRTVALKLDLPNHLESASLDAAAQKELDAKVKELLGVLAKRNPAVQVVEPRPLEELEYPLEL